MTDDDAPEIPVAVCDLVASWQRVFAARKDHVDPHDLLRSAAVDLFETLNTNRTVYPDSDAVARQFTVDALQQMAESAGIEPDDAQAIFARAVSHDATEDAKSRNRRIVDGLLRRNRLIEPIRLTYFGELDQPAPKPWLIKNVMARGECSSWIAPPGKGKSALLGDISIHGASSSQWRGYRIKENFGSIYFALERADLDKRRMIAHRLRDNLPIDLPIAISGQVIDLMDRNCVGNIVDAIKEAEDRFGRGIGLATFDTYAKGIAAGGGDESLAKDQNAALANLRRVIDKVGIHIATVGHTGKDESRGERGSNAKLADVDLLVQISGDTIKTATVNKANDQPQGPLTSFRLEPFEFGTDEDGDPFRTFIISEEILTAAATDRPLSDQQRLAIEALNEVTLSHGIDLAAIDGLPAGLKSVTAEQWKAELYRRNVLDKEAKNPRARFNELRTRLAGKKLIGTRDALVWVCR